MIRVGPLVAVALAAALAVPARADRSTPFLDDLEALVRSLDAALPDPSTRAEQVRKRSLENALAALERDSATIGEDVRIQADAASALWAGYRRDLEVAAAVDYTHNLHFSRFLGLAERYRASSRKAASEERHLAGRRARRFWLLFADRTTADRTWRGTARRLVRAAAEIDAIADLLEIERPRTAPQGSVTAVMSTVSGDVGLSFRISHAGRAGPSEEFLVEAFALDTDPDVADHMIFLTRGLVDPHDGAVYPQSGDPPVGASYTNRGDIRLQERAFLPPSEPFAVGFRDFLPDHSFGTNVLEIETWDPLRGAASGRFQFVMNATTGGLPVVVTGRFDVTGGLEAE